MKNWPKLILGKVIIYPNFSFICPYLVLFNIFPTIYLYLPPNLALFALIWSYYHYIP